MMMMMDSFKWGAMIIADEAKRRMQEAEAAGNEDEQG